MRKQFHAGNKTLEFFTPDDDGIIVRVSDMDVLKIKEALVEKYRDTGIPGDFVLILVPEQAGVAFSVVGRSEETWFFVYGTTSARDFVHECGIEV